MKKMVMRNGILIALLAALVIPSTALSITKEQIITLSGLGISEAEIIAAIEKDKTVFNLQVTDILALKQANVPEGVIKHMLQSAQLYGGGAPAAPGGQAAPAEVQRPKTPAEIAAEQRRIREEAMKMAAEAKAAQERQRKAFAEGMLKRGRDLAEAGKYVEAINEFEKFRSEGNYQPGSEEAYIADYGIANALAKAGLYQSAAKTLVDVVLQGPDRPFFQSAMTDLRSLRKEISYSPPELEELTNFYVGEFSQAFQDSFHYTLGEFFYDYKNYAQALKYLDQVSSTSEDYGKALYLKGLVQVQNKLWRSALESFQNSILATEENKSDSEVADLAYLALARIAYESNNFDAAIYYYRKVSEESVKLATAFYESAWTYFIKGDYSRALGTFQALHSPVFEHYFYPELWVLEATIYLNLCHTDLTRKAIEMFNNRVAVLSQPLEEFLRSARRPSDFYDAVMKTGNNEAYLLDEALLKPVYANVDFFNLYSTVRQIESEMVQLQAEGSGLGAYQAALLGKLKAQQVAKVNEIGIKIQQIMRRTQDELREYSVKITEIEVELDMLEMQDIDAEIAALSGEEVVQKTESDSSETGMAIVGADSLNWPFESEYWSDEVKAYRAFISERCNK